MPVTTVTAPDGKKVKVTHPEGASKEQILEYARSNYSPNDQSIGETLTRGAAGLGADIAVSETGKLAGAAAGTAVAPGVGTAIGYVVGAIGSGASGSLSRQKIMNPDGDIRWGEVVADSLINLIPAGKVVKGGTMIGRAGKEAVKRGIVGGAIGAGGQVVESAIEEGRLPTMDELKSRGITSTLLGAGLGVSGEAFRKAYAKYAGMPSSHLTDALRAGDEDAKIIVDGIRISSKRYTDSLRKKYKERYDKIREDLSDELTKARSLQKQSGGGQYINKNGVLEVVSDESDYYMQRRLAEAVIQDKNKSIAQRIDLDKDFLSVKSKQIGRSVGELSDSVDQYLKAKHAIDYNRELGDNAAGITTAQAKEIIERFQKQGLVEELGESIKMRQDASREILDTLVEGGIVSDELSNTLRKKYPNYVPLNRVMQEEGFEDEIMYPLIAGTSKYETRGTGLRTAVGSERETRNITQNIYENYAGAVRRAEVNKANIAFKKLLEDNPDNSIAKIRKPKARGFDFNKKPIMEESRNNVLTVYDGGEKFFIEFDDMNLAREFKGMNRGELGWFLKGSYAHNRFLGGLLTRWNPGFLAPNLMRDRIEATVNNLSKMKDSAAIKTLNPVNDMITIERNLRGISPRNDKEIALDGLYQRFKASGGSSGGLGLSTVKHIEDEIAKMALNLRQPSHQLAAKFTRIVNGINEVFEDATRFGTFRRGIESGMTDKQAALAARDSSFDPLLKGAKGDEMKALWMFSNPALQSVKNFTRSMTKNKTGLKVMAGLTGITLAVDRWNQRYDKDWREKLKTQDGSNWKTNKHFIMIHGKNDDGTFKYASIPVGYSAVPFKVMADKTQQIVTGQKVGNPAEIAAEVAGEMFDSYNPTGGSAVPTVFRPWVELATNKDGLGRDIRPEWLENRNISAVEKVYPWTAETYGGELAMSLAEDLAGKGLEVSPENMLHIYRMYTGGPGKTVQRMFNVAAKLYNNQKIDRSDVPVARRFFGETYASAFERRNGQRQIIQNIDKQENTDSAKASRIASTLFSKYRDAGGGENGIAAVSAAIRGDGDVNESVIRRLSERIKSDMAGVTYTDTEIQGLGVESGARAKAYASILENMDHDERMPYIQDQISKGIMSKKVQQQLILRHQVQNLFGQQK